MRRKAFTLIEVLLVIIIIAVLTTIVLIAINPARQIAQARNTQRASAVNTILNAVSQYIIDNSGQLPVGVDTNLRMLGTDATGCDVSCGATGGGGGGGGPIAINDDTQVEFDMGTYSGTQWDVVNNWLELNSAGQTAGSGTYTSTITDATSGTTWENSSWTPERPIGKTLPDNQGIETDYNSGNANMSTNVLLTHLDEAAGAIVNSSGVGTNCTLNGTLYNQSGQFDTAIGFDGNNDEINCGNDASLNLTNSLTIEFWINGSFANFPDIVTKGDYTQSYSIWIDATGQVQFVINNSTLSGNIAIPTNQWHHVAVTFGGGTRRIYIDGVQDVSGAYGGSIDVIPNDLTISSSAWSLNGKMDELAIYSSALSATEILDHYQRGALGLSYQVRSCDDAACAGESFIGPDGTAGTAYSEASNSAIGLPNFNLTNVIDNQYFQYRATYSTINSSYTPEVLGVLVNGTMAGGGGGGGGETTQAACLDLSSELATFIPEIPYDVQAGTATKTYYAIKEGVAGDRVTVMACSPELGIDINASR